MRKTIFAFAVAFLAAPASPNTLIDNVNGIQVGPNGAIEHFRALLIDDDGKVIRTIGANELDDLDVQRSVDEHGQTLLPGFIDAHGHVIELGAHALQLDLVGTRSLTELQQRLRDYAAANPDAKWILGAGWNQELWPDKRFPTAADLDAAVPDRPVVLGRVDGHALVANSAAMRAAGVTPQTPAPAGGEIENGLFVDHAKALINRAVPPATDADLDRQLAKAQDILLRFGVTGVGSMSTALGDWNAMKRAGDAGRLNVRFMVYADELNLLKEVPHPTAWLYGDKLRMVGIKFYADGALGSRGAWMKQPYSDQPDTTGNRLHSDAELRAMADTAAAAGFQIAIHAIGDAANAQVISTYEWLDGKYGLNRRWRIEHAQVVDCADLPRIGRGHMIASMQPTHQTSDRLMAEKRLGLARLRCAYAWQSILKTGAKLAFGTDFPVESPNPFPGLAAAISRQDINGQPPGGWFPEERLSFEQALHAYTRGAAYAGFAEDRIGSLDPGKWADFVIVDRDISTASVPELYRTQVLETWVAGKKVWSRPPAPSATERGR
jgi:predicted amidohydrolase YtcJ